jgi:hypothetical protein
VDENVLVALDALEPSAGEDERLAAHDCAVPVVHMRWDDEVHLPELVLEQHEDDPFRGRRTLTRDSHPGDAHSRAMRLISERARRQSALRQMLAQELERMLIDGDAG